MIFNLFRNETDYIMNEAAFKKQPHKYIEVFIPLQSILKINPVSPH